MNKAILKLLRSGNYMTLNKKLVKKIGLFPATIYTEMLGKYIYYSDNNRLKNGYFYLTIDTLKDELGVSRDQQNTAINKLIGFGLITKKIAKMKGDECAKRYFKVTADLKLIASMFDMDNIDNMDNKDDKDNIDDKDDKDDMDNKTEHKTPKTPDNTSSDSNTQIEISSCNFSTCRKPSENKTNSQNYNNKNKIKNQSIHHRLPDKQQPDDIGIETIEPSISNKLKSLYKQAKLDLFTDTEIKNNLMLTIKQLYLDSTTASIISNIKLEHIDDALFRMRTELVEKVIKYPQKYFRKVLVNCILSNAINTNIFSMC